MDSWVCIAAILFCCGARRQNFRKPQFGVYTVWSPWEFKQIYDVFENSRDLMHLVFKSLHRNRNVALLWLKKKTSETVIDQTYNSITSKYTEAIFVLQFF